jgi:hypothetical protein
MTCYPASLARSHEVGFYLLFDMIHITTGTGSMNHCGLYEAKEIVGVL